MTEIRRNVGEDKLYRYPDPLPQDDLGRMELPQDTYPDFVEVQPFDQAWIWTMLGFETLIILIPLILTGQTWWVIAIAMAAMALSMALLASLKLKTRIDDEGVRYRLQPFHMREKLILWDEIDTIHVRKYSPMAEYGGWGMRHSIKHGKAFNVRGNYGIQIVLKSGKKILIGTQKAEEAARVLEKKPLTV